MIDGVTLGDACRVGAFGGLIGIFSDAEQSVRALACVAASSGCRRDRRVRGAGVRPAGVIAAVLVVISLGNLLSGHFVKLEDDE